MQVKVWNDNHYDFSQKFKGHKITVPAKKFVEMEYEEAIEFKGAFSSMPPPDDPDPARYYKMIRIEMPEGGFSPAPTDEYFDAVTGRSFANKDDYIKHLKSQLEERGSDLVVDPVAERELQAKQKRAK